MGPFLLTFGDLESNQGQIKVTDFSMKCTFSFILNLVLFFLESLEHTFYYKEAGFLQADVDEFYRLSLNLKAYKETDLYYNSEYRANFPKEKQGKHK